MERSKNISRDQQALTSEKELKSNSVRNAADDIGQKKLRLGQLKSQQEKRMRDEAALRELQETLASLQGQLKVSCHHTSYADSSKHLRRLMALLKLPKLPGVKR